MSPSRLLLPVCWAVAMAAACSSSSGLPPELGDCVKTGDAGCSTSVTGGGGSGPGGDGGEGEGSVLGEGSTTCGAAENALGTQNTTCIPCIESSCCGDDTACSAQTGAGGCLSIVQCEITCGTSTSCQQQCTGTASAAGTQSYNDFSSCLAASCPGCPALPGLDFNDF